MSFKCRTMLLFAIVFFATFADSSSGSSVIELKDDDFRSRVSDFETALIMFYAPWCAHCKRLKPEFDKASMELKKKFTPVQLLKVDCIEDGKETCRTFSVSSYPTLKIFKYGKILPRDYPGPRNAKSIVKYMLRQVGPGYVEINSKNAYENFLSPQGADDFENRVVGFFKDESLMRNVYLKTADLYRDKFKFGFTSLPALLKKNGNEDSIILYRPKQLHNIFEPSELKFEGGPVPSDIEAWLENNIHGLVDLRTQQNQEEFLLPLVVAYYNVDYEKDAKNTNYWRNRILKVAKDFASDFSFAISPKNQNQHEIQMEFNLPFPGSDKPIILARDAIGKKYPMAGEFSVENFESFLRKIKNQEILPYVRSEPIPKDNNGPVKEAVGKNFYEVVMYNGKDTLIQFYVPPSWCARCLKLSTIWKQLGEKMNGENVAIVKMDAEANDVPLGFETDPPPTIYWIPKNRRDSPVKYTGKHELKDLIKYVAMHATEELKSYNRNGKRRASQDVKDKLMKKFNKEVLKYESSKAKRTIKDKLITEDGKAGLKTKDKVSYKKDKKPKTKEHLSTKKQGDVIELTDSDFETEIRYYDLSLVMFYVPRCDACKKLEPDFDKAASELAQVAAPIRMVKVDCTEGKSACDSLDVESYPTLKIFKKGEFFKDYKGDRDADGIVEYMRQLGPAASELNTKEAYESFISGGDPAVVAFFNSGSMLKKAFLQTAVNLETFKFGIISKPELLEKTEDRDFILLVRPKHLHNVFEPSTLEYSGKATMSALMSWLKENQHGLVDIRTPNNDEEFKSPLIVAYYNVDYDRNAKNTNYWRNRILKVAKDFASDFTFAISNIRYYRYQLMSEFGYKPSSPEKPVVFARDEDDRKFIMKEEFSPENFESFLKKLSNNELHPYVKSQPVPEHIDKPVKTAVATNFDDVVINNHQDTLIQFYAPWCGHCKRLSPIWDKLGEKMKDEDVAIVKMDADGNDVPSPKYKVSDFPTIYWAPKDRKQSPVEYDGETELKDLIAFIAEHATNELKNYDRKGIPIGRKDEL